MELTWSDNYKQNNNKHENDDNDNDNDNDNNNNNNNNNNDTVIMGYRIKLVKRAKYKMLEILEKCCLLPTLLQCILIAAETKSP